MTLSEELTWRGFVNQTTLKDISDLDNTKRTFYWGVDPSAPSMTIGNLAAAMMVKHFINHGHKAILLIGGATGMIGDPDGKAQERDLKSLEEVSDNKKAIVEQYKQFFAGSDFDVVDNYDWFRKMNYLEFLRDIGKHVPMRQMLGRDFVQTRLSETGAGISYAEFSYVLIQAYDFLHLHRTKGVTLQVCGSDQWGNSIAGVDLIRRVTGNETHVWSTPLIVNNTTGVKFGKSEDGAVWLDSVLTSPYKFYQFWLNVDDGAVIDYLKIFTFLSETEINQIRADFDTGRASRIAQKTLAYEVTKLVHGVDQAEKQKTIADALFSNHDISKLNESMIATVREELPSIKVKAGDEVAEVLVDLGLAKSKSEARQLIADGSVYFNNARTNKAEVEKSDFLGGKLLIRKGKTYKNTAFVELVPQQPYSKGSEQRATAPDAPASTKTYLDTP